MLPAIDPAFVITDPALETIFPATLLAADPALETTVPATLVAADAELVAVSTRLVTAALRRYQMTKRLIALDRGLLLLGSKAEEESGSFGSN